MYGFSSGPVLLVNAEVDSMGGVVEGVVGAGIVTSHQRAVIDKVQADLRQEYDVREERRRELEFLEKGGDPLEFKLSTTSSLSLQSTSVTDQQPNQFVSSEAKGSFAHAASPHGDSVESSGRPVARLLCEPDCADNLMLFDGENELPEVDRILAHPSKCNLTPSEQSPQLDVQESSKELKNSAAFNVPRNSYRRRSRPNREGPKTGTNNVEMQTDQTVLANPNPVPSSPNKGTISKSSENPSESDGVKAAESTGNVNDHDNQQMLLTAQRSPGLVPEDQECSHKQEDFGYAVLDGQPCVAITKLEDLAPSAQMNGCGGDIQKNSVAVASKVLDSESSCTSMFSNSDGCNGNELSTNQKGTGNIKEHILVHQVTLVKEEATDMEQKDGQHLDYAVINDDDKLNHQNQENELQRGAEKEVNINSLVLVNIVKDPMNINSSVTDNPVTRNGAVPVVTNPEPVKLSLVELPEPKLSIENSAATMERQEINAKAVSKADEDAILKEAGVIEAKHKRIAELSASVFPVVNCRKSHWGYVLDEMAWLANDFAQERLWKMTAAARLCHLVARTSQFRFQEKHRIREQRRVANILSDAVMQFWNTVQDSNKDTLVSCRKDSVLAIRQYAVNFLNSNSSCVQHNQAEAPPTPERNSDLGMVDMSWDDNWTEEELFYLVPSGAVKTYRKSFESHVAQYEKTGSSLQEEVETSAFDAVTAYGALQNAYEEEEGETSTYDFDITNSSGYAPKKRKILPNGYGRRSYVVGADSFHKLGTQQADCKAKRPGNLNVSIPTKRVRTATRHKGVSPFTAGTSGYVPLQSNADASSGDTSSFHDDKSSPYFGSIMPNNLEVESVRDFEKILPFDSTEVSKPRKKKKRKHLGSAYEQRWQVDSNFKSEQRDHSKKRSEGQQLGSNDCVGLPGQHISKKPKVMRSSPLDNSFDNISPVAGSLPSPVASQMSNMSNPNIKIVGGLERGRKTKSSKVPSRQQICGSPWSQFEDQALIVLVHDMGPNWEFVSDAINCTLQFKCIFRKPNECKERHMFLMDRSTGDGADSAEDSGSSQPYPSTLPGIPKGSARQLFQQLQRPMEEETLKSHFEKIIIIVQRQHLQKSQNGNHDPKQLQQPHSSHMMALSNVSPNNLNGAVLTPPDLFDPTPPEPDIFSSGYQSPQNSCLPALQRPPTMLVTNNLSSPGSLNPHVRDGCLGLPGSASLSIDEYQRMRQYHQLLPAGYVQQPVPTASEIGTDSSMRIFPGSNGMGALGGVNNRSGPVSRPEFQAMAPSPNSSGMVMMPSPVNMLSRSSTRTRDSPHMMRVPQETQGVATYGSNSTFPNQMGVPHMRVPSRLLHQQSLPVSPKQPQMLGNRPHFQGGNQASNPQHQAHVLRLMKERQLRQRILQRQQQLVSSSAVPPPAQPPPQLPISQISSPPVPFSTLPPSVPHHQQKHQMPSHGVIRNSQIGGSGLSNHVSKQRRQPQQPQQPQNTKHVKEAGRGNIIQQSTSTNSCLLNGNPSTERSEQAMHSVQCQGLYIGSPSNSVQNTQKFHPASSVLPAGNDATEGTPVVSSSSDQKNASEQLHDSVTPTLLSNFASAGTHVDGADKDMESLGCKQSLQKAHSSVSLSQPSKSPVSEMQLQRLPQLQQSQQQGPVVQPGNSNGYLKPDDPIVN